MIAAIHDCPGHDPTPLRRGPQCRGRITTFWAGANFQEIKISKNEMGASGWRGSIRLAEALWCVFVQNFGNTGKIKYAKRVQKNLEIHPSLLSADAGNYISQDFLRLGYGLLWN